MIQNTVFVVGAGASKEANLPTGDELKEKISKLLDIRFDEFGHRRISGDSVIFEALSSHVNQLNDGRIDVNAFLDEAWHIRDALPLAISIDNFIDAHRDNDKIALCGKLAIVRSILSAERQSHLFSSSSSSPDSRNLENTWYIPFFELLTKNCTENDLEARFKSITLIIFNYDRCIEHFLCHALKDYYNISISDSAKLVKFINIYHPYGDVGALPWSDQRNSQNESMAFGAKPNARQLLDLTREIKTYTEAIDPSSTEITEIRKHMGSANKLIFLGFAFHEQNLQLITPDSTDRIPDLFPKCFATTYKFSESDEENIKYQLKSLCKIHALLPKNIKTQNLKCHDFFQYFGKSLAII